VNSKGITQFTPKPNKFPRCIGDDPTAADFAIATYPESQSVTLEFHDPTDPSTTPGTHHVRAFMQACPKKKIEASYEVLNWGANPPQCSQITFDNVNQSFTGARHTDFGAWSTITYIRNGTATGTGTLGSMIWDSGWVGCEQDIAVTQAKSFEVGVDLEGKWKEYAKVGVSFTWNTTTSVTVSKTHESNKEYRIQAFNQNMVITCAGTNVTSDLCTSDPEGGFSSCTGQTPDGSSFSDTFNGYASPLVQTCWRCCRVSGG